VSDALIAHRAYLESLSQAAGSEAAPNGLPGREGDLVAAISQIQNAIREQLREERSLLLESKTDTSSRAEPTTARLINRLAAHRIILALLLTYCAGLITQPLFHYLFTFWKH
jgi:hypothetical protein